MNLFKFIPTLIYICVIWIVSSGPIEFHVAGGFDKVLHLIEYSILGVLLAFGIELRMKEFPEKIYFILFIGLLFGMMDEIHQYYVPSRTFDLFDLFADIAGVMIGALIYLFFTHILQIVNELKSLFEKGFKVFKC